MDITNYHYNITYYMVAQKINRENKKWRERTKS